MTENVKHVDTLRKVVKLLQNTPALQGREHDSLGIAFNKAIDYFAQREAAGDGEGVDLFAKSVPTSYVRERGQDMDRWVRLGDAEHAPRPTGTLQERLSQDTVLGRNVLPSPASAEPGEVLDDEGRCRCGCTESCAHAAELRAELNRTRAVVQRMIAEDNELYAKEHPDAHGGRGGGGLANPLPRRRLGRMQ